MLFYLRKNEIFKNHKLFKIIFVLKMHEQRQSIALSEAQGSRNRAALQSLLLTLCGTIC
jgi:hypothetical protein